MNLKKNLISVIMVIAVLVVLSTNVFASEFSNLLLSENTDANGTTNGTTIEIINSNTNATTNSPDKLANTGLEELPWLVIGICAVSAIFAYRKIKEYKAY